MSKESSNPFVLPGFGQDGEAARNPLFAGLEMMRQAWQGMAGGGFESPGLPLMSVEDLDRRIGELRSVQNWLQLNASILGNTIQGLEIQRATLSTLRSFADRGMPDAFARATAAAQAPAAPDTPDAEPPQRAAPPDADEASGDAAATTQAYAQAAGDWWNLLQQQFQTLADATAASLQGAADAAPAAKPAARKAAAKRPNTSKSGARASRAKPRT
ncbi:PhaM family polyhydroxyalkanoate granule multifunctional regulatory protein [Castellaniella sp. GW247-6E4]|uniref:PhaM family polyhydroxyalkanoate granule multifunctional regulatory protein n=1 Tax=Castellaniella sp. GW247-6E4 TaxID=3140380 RepID=UPI0033150465